MSMMSAQSRPVLPRTGQTASYAAGDDGYYRAGNPRATRLVNHGDGTAGDRATGLQWVLDPAILIPGPPLAGVPSNQVQAARGAWATATAYAAADLVTQGGLYYVCAAAHVAGVFATDLAAGKWRQTVWTASAANLATPAAMTWANALSGSLDLEYAGHSDWRLPNATELLSIVDWSKGASGGEAAILAPLAGVPAWDSTYYARYWSSTTYAANNAVAWWVSFRGGYVYRATADSKTAVSCYVRPVRGGRINANWP